MQKYQKTYFVDMGYDLKHVKSGLIDLPSEVSGINANEIHHIHDPAFYCHRQDYPVERMIMLTRAEHTKFGDKKQYFDWLMWMHILTMIQRNRPIKWSSLPESVFPVLHQDMLVAEHFYGWVAQNRLVSCIDIEQYSVCVSVLGLDDTVIMSSNQGTKELCYQELIKLI